MSLESKDLLSGERDNDATERQLVHYNARDTAKFIACYSEDVVVDDALGARMYSGREAMAERYGAMFAAYPDLRCEVVARIRVGAFVIHEEHITGRKPEREHAVAVYHLREDGLIDHVRFLR